MKLPRKLECARVLSFTLQSASFCLAGVRSHLDAVSNLGPTVQESVQQTGVSPMDTTKMVQGA